MHDPDPDRIARLERRVAELEARLTAMAPGGGPIVNASAMPPAAAGAVPPPAGSGAPGLPLATAAWAPPPAPAPWAPPPPRPTGPVWGSTGPAAAPAAAAARAAPSAPRSFAELEEQLSSRLLAWVGGIALVLGAMFFLSLAFTRGWIGPEARVLIGLIAGAAALVAGAWLFERGNRTPALVLTGVGVGVGSLALFAASRLYEFIPNEIALVGFLVLAVGCAAIALRANSQAVAAFGILATTVAPPVLGASPNLVTIAFLGAALVGTAVISFGRSWPWLALLAFLATAPQAASWFSDEPSTALIVAGIGAFWTVNALAAAGPAIAGLRTTVHMGAASLFVLNALFAIVSLHGFLPDDPLLRSVGLIVLADLHGVLALLLLVRRPGRDPFGMLAAGLAVGTLAIGIAIELGGSGPAIGNTVLATVVAWVAVRFRDRIGAAWAAAVGSLALLRLVSFEYPLRSFGRTSAEGWPFASPEGIAVVIMAAALLLTGFIACRSFTRTAVGSWPAAANLALAGGCLSAIAVIAYACDFELQPDLRIVAWAILASAAFGLAAVVRRDPPAWTSAMIGGWAILASAAALVLAIVAPVSRLVVDAGRGSGVVPLLNGESLALGALAVALAVAGRVLARWSPPFAASDANALRNASSAATAASAAAGATLLYLVSIAIIDAFQARVGPVGATDEIATQAQVALSITWVLVGAAAFAVGLIYRIGLARAFGLGLLALATGKVFLFDLASLDVAYRVLSFIGLGGVLLASSFVAARFRAPGAPPAADR